MSKSLVTFEKCINGERTLDGSRGSWELPLEPHLGGVEPDWGWCGDEGAAKIGKEVPHDNVSVDDSLYESGVEVEIGSGDGIDGNGGGDDHITQHPT